MFPLEATIQDVHEAYRTRQISCVELVNLYLERVCNLDLQTQSRPPLNAIAWINPRVLDEAKRCDQEMAHGVSKPLHGIPVWVKDNIDVSALPTSCGSIAFADTIATGDAALVSNLRQAGALIMGKAAMAEFGAGLSPLSSRSGRTGNAYDTRNPPGGSSHGSAVATSVNFGMVSVGVDDATSVVVPAAFNGIVGLRPSIRLVSTHGIALASPTDTSAGPMARTVADLAQLMAVLTDGNAPPPCGQEANSQPSFPPTFDRAALQGKRIGVLESFGKVRVHPAFMPEECLALLEHALTAMEAAGATIVRDLHLTRFNPQRLSFIDYYNGLLTLLRRRATPPRTYRELLKGHVAPTSREIYRNYLWVRFGPSMRLPNVFCRYYRSVLRRNRQAMESFLDQHALDALVCITSPILALLSTLTQTPHLTVPAGYFQDRQQVFFLDGTVVPMGISLLGRQFADRDLMQMAYAYEQLTGHRKAPEHVVSQAARLPVDIKKFNHLKVQIGQVTSERMYVDAHGTERPDFDEFTSIVEGLVESGRQLI